MNAAGTLLDRIRLPEDPIARRNRAIRDGLSIAGVLVASFMFWTAATQIHDIGFDTQAYWGLDWSDLYGGSVTADGFDVYRYSPAFAQLLAPLSLLPFNVFLVLWTSLLAGVLAWMGRSWTLALLAFPPVTSELIHGNIHLLMAAMIVLGFRSPWMWSLILLAKVTPGIGLGWFAARREWRGLAVALGATAALVLVSAALSPSLWVDWIESLTRTQAATGGNQIPIPLLPRLVVALIVVIWGARTDRLWTVPVAVVLALPTIWVHGLSVLVAIVPIERARRRGSPPAVRAP